MKRLITVLLLAALLTGCAAPTPVQPVGEQASRLDASTEAETAFSEAVGALTGETVTITEDIYLATPATEDVSLDEVSLSNYVNNTLILYAVIGTPRSEVEALAAANGAVISGEYADLEIYQLQFPEAMTLNVLNTIADTIAQDARVDEIGVDYVYLTEGDATFSDPWPCSCSKTRFDHPHPSNNAWGIEAIGAPAAWEHLGAMTAVRVGLVEHLVDSDHEDVNLCGVVNASGVAAFTSGIYGMFSNDASNHGTHVAGTMAATADNGVGIAGVCAIPGTEIYTCNTHGAQSVANYMTGLCSLITEYGVCVVNVSQHSGGENLIFAASHGNEKAIRTIEDQAARAASYLQRLIDKNYEFVICVCAGNLNSTKFYKTDEPLNSDLEATYGYSKGRTLFSGKTAYTGTDARYSHYLNCIEAPAVKERIIVVGSCGLDEGASIAGIAADLEGESEISTAGAYYIAPSSNAGNRVDVVAPGEHITSALYNNRYGCMSGTSMATPHVSGVAAMLFACDSRLTGAEVKEIICATADTDISFDGVDAHLLQADAAVELALEWNQEYAPCAIEMMETTYGEAAADAYWTSVNFFESFDNPGIWFAQFQADGLSFAAHYSGEEGSADAMPSDVRIQDWSGGELHIPITENITTGDTLGALRAQGIFVDPEFVSASVSDTAYFTIIDGRYCLALYFTGVGDDAILTDVFIEYF